MSSKHNSVDDSSLLLWQDLQTPQRLDERGQSSRASIPSAGANLGELLFCYGTLMHPYIMEQAAGGPFPHTTGLLKDYASYCLEGQVFPGVVAEVGAQCVGVLYWGLSAGHLLRLDLYEGGWYERRRVEVWVDNTSHAAWAYLLSPHGMAHLQHQPWSYANFIRRYLGRYLEDV